MEFRWVAVIALWTFLIGPVFDHPGCPALKVRPRAQAAGR